MFERFTDRARKVMALANQEAQRYNHEYIGTEHILLGLVKEGAGVGANVLHNMDIDLQRVRLEIEKLVKHGPDKVHAGQLPQTPRAKKVIEYAIDESRGLDHDYVGTEHLLLGLLREHEGVAAQVLMNLGLKLEEVREEVLNLLSAGVECDAGRPGQPSPTRTVETVRVLDRATELAQVADSQYAQPLHVLLALLEDEQIAAILKQADVNLEKVRARIRSELGGE